MSCSYWRLCTSSSFCCLLRSSVSRSEGRRCAISSSLCSSSLRCSSTRFSSGFSSSSRPLHSHPESRHTNFVLLSPPPKKKKSANQSVDVRPAVPFVAEQQLPVEVLVTGCLSWGAVQLPGLSALVVQVCCGLSEQCWLTNDGLWGVRYTATHVTCDHDHDSIVNCIFWQKMALKPTIDKCSTIWFVYGNKQLSVLFLLCTSHVITTIKNLLESFKYIFNKSDWLCVLLSFEALLRFCFPTFFGISISCFLKKIKTTTLWVAQSA